MKQSVVETIKVSKIFRDFWMREKVTAVDQLDMAVYPHEVFGLLGPNGSGKSTTLKMILGLLFPTHGRITVLGKAPTDVRAKARIGFLPEESYLYPFLDAHETLEFYGRLFHQNRAERRRRIDMLLEMVGLTSVAYRRIGEYSKGMQRRIGLAQALINDPDLLILDEPTSGMDPIGTREFKDLIRMLAARGKTVLLSSHLLPDVEDVCDRVCILYGGKKRAMGSVEDLLARRNSLQITTEDLDERTLQQVQSVLTVAGKTARISHPRDRLEDLFLRTVHEAQEQQLATGGAIAGGKVAAFLQPEPLEGQGVIEHLVQSAQEVAELPVDAPVEPKPQAPRQDVVKELIDSAKLPAEPVAEAPPPASSQSRETDRSILDSLLKPRGPEES